MKISIGNDSRSPSDGHPTSIAISRTRTKTRTRTRNAVKSPTHHHWLTSYSSVSLFVYLFTLSLLFIVTELVSSTAKSDIHSTYSQEAASGQSALQPTTSTTSRYLRRHSPPTSNSDEARWFTSTSRQQSKTVHRWPPLLAGHHHQWRRVSEDDHEQQVSADGPLEELQEQLPLHAAQRYFHKHHEAGKLTKSPVAKTAATTSTATTNSGNSKSLRQIRQAEHHGDRQSSMDSQSQPSMSAGSMSASILSQDHVILDHHSSFRHKQTQHQQQQRLNFNQAPQSLIFIQSPRSSGGGDASDNAETFYIRKGANGTLPCLPVLPADSQATQNKIEWFKEEKKLMEAEAKRIVVWNTKNSIAYLPETGALLFRGVTNEDSGEYHCVLTKTTGTGESEDGVVRFYVQDVPDPPQMPIVTGFTQRSVNLSWVPSYDFHWSPILHYVIHVREGVDGAWDVANGIMTPDNRTQYEIIGLKPFTTYSFRVLAVNSIGVGEPSPPSHYIITLRQKPDSRLSIISARNVSSSAIRLEWLPPSAKEIHGEFLGYRIRYVPQLHEHTMPAVRNSSSSSASGGSSSSSYQVIGSNQQQHYSTANSLRQPSLDGPLSKDIIVGDTKETSYTIKGLQTYTPYRISVQVSNPAGDGPVAEVLAMTDEGVASPPLDLTVLKATDTTVKLRWSEPKAPNGILQGYQITLHDIAQNLNETRKLSDPQSKMEHTIGELKPYTWYLVHIQAYSRKFLGEPSQQVKFRTDVSGPSPPQLLNVTCYSSDSILIQWQRPDEYYNQIDFYYVKYKPQESGWDSYTSLTGVGGSGSKEEETILSAKKDKLLNELLITNLTAEELYELKVLAGTRSIHDPSHVYRSEPSQTFRVVLKANCESYTAYPITENTFNMSLAVGILCASLALVLVTSFLIFWRRRCQAAYYYLDEPQDASRGTNSPQLSETYDDSEYGSIPVADWQKHVQKLHADSDIGFAREFEQIQQANQKQSSALTCDHSQLPENKHKNRYINIVAYDHTRVILRPPIGGQKKPGHDYINANFIDGYNKPRAYIGTQGPLVSTFDDYWRMIWEQHVVIIVMITNLQERGRRKCDMYWPKEGSETYGYIQVKLLQEVVMATYTLRTFTVRNLKLKKRSGADRTCYQYHYTNWPDHGVPDHPLPVLSFVRKSAKANPPGAGAIICHCSAGCGRSGTYIVIDAMLKQIRHKQSINVVDFLKHIRAQRNYLVQTEEQYVFIHDSLVEAIESGETEIPSNLIGKYIQFLQTGGANLAALAAAGDKQQLGSNYSLMNGLCQSPLSGANTLSVAAATAHPGEQQLISTSNSNLLIGAAGAANNQKSASSLANSQTTTVSRSQSGGGAGQWSLLERQYRLVASFKAKDFCVVSALKPCNKIKNRTLNLIPLEAHRVHITPKPGADGSDYINATFLMGFNHLHEFIATQHPVQETFSDFWQMVYDHNSQTIVLLTQMEGPQAQLAKEFPQFWPQKEDEVDYGSFKVKLQQESTLMKAENGGLIITRDFIMRSNQDDYELQTRIIHCPGWPDCCGPLSAVFDLIQVVQQATQQQASAHQLHDGQTRSGTVTIGQEHEPQNGGPIIVVDKFGGTEAATFAVLTTLFKQINFEDAVDVYMYAKLAHLRRPGIWSSQDDYLFLYRAMENYASSLLQARQQAASAGSSAEAKQAAAASLTAPLSYANLHHHQTMTLDRKRAQKSSPSLSSATLKSSTMKRQPSSKQAQQGLHHHHHQQQQQQQQQQQKQFASQTPVTSQQVLAQAPHQQHQPHTIMMMNSQQQLHHTIGAEFMMAHKQKQIHQLHGQQQQQQHDFNHNTLQFAPQSTNGADLMMQTGANKQMPKGSPYNSAASIGASSHQHLLAANTNTSGRPVAAVSANQAQNHQATANDHYNLYSIQ